MSWDRRAFSNRVGGWAPTGSREYDRLVWASIMPTRFGLSNVALAVELESC